MTSNYEVRVSEGTWFCTDMRMRQLYTGEIVRVDTGAVAFKSKTYHEKRTARLQAARYLKRYEYHLAKHGIGFEEQEEQRKAQERAARDAKRKADRRVRDAAPDLLAALEGLLAMPAATGTAPDRHIKRDAAIAAARAAIAKATGTAD